MSSTDEIHTAEPSLSNEACVVIVTYNHNDYIEECIESVLESGPSEVVIVDTGSTDGTLETVETGFPEVRLIQCEDNIGYGAGNNRAVEDIDCEYVVVLNPDTRLSSNCLDELLQPLTGTDDVITVPKILTYEGRMINTIGTWTHFSGLAFVRGYKRSPEEYPEPRELSGLSGACFATTLKTYEAMGGFEESIFIYMDDVEFSWKANAMDIEIKYVPDAIVYHDYPGTDITANKLFHLERGRCLILRKYLDTKTAALLLPSLLLTEILTWGYAILLGIDGIRSKIRGMQDGFAADIEKVAVDSEELVTRLNSQIPEEELPFSDNINLFIKGVNKVYALNARVLNQ